MRKSEILRGRGVFRGVTNAGRRSDGKYLRSYTIVTQSAEPSLAIGVTVYDRTLNAVQRNRIKRQLRASVDRERNRLFAAVTGAGVAVHMVLGYRARGSTEKHHTPFVELHADVARVIDGIISRIRQQWPQQ